MMSYNELKEFVNQQWENMDEEEKYTRQMYNDPTFEEFVLSSIKPGNFIEINYEDLSFTIT